MATPLELIKRDIKSFVNAGGFQVDITMLTPDKSITYNFTGWGVTHHLSFDSDGNQVNSKIARVTVDENVLISKGVVVRNSKGIVKLENFKIQFVDSSGNLRSYNVRESFPDLFFGMIVLILEDAKL